MRAAFLLEPGKIEIREVDSPIPGPGEVVVSVERALTCGTDLKAYRRGHPFIPMPGRFGHQYSGIIDAVGPKTDGFTPGMPIIGVHSGPCGECPCCMRSRPNLCQRFGEQLVIGAFAEKLLVTSRVVRANLLPRPAGLSAERAAFLEPMSCVVHALRQLDFRGVDRVLVLGLGSMGLIFLQLLALFTKARITAAGRRAERLALAQSLVTHVIDIETQSLSHVLSKDEDFGVVIECTGQLEGWQAAIERVAPGGQVMLFGGLPKGSTVPIDTYRLHYEELKIQGSFHFSPEDVRQSAKMLADPRLKLEVMIKETVGLDRLEEVLIAMANGNGIKYAIDPSA